MRLAPQKQHLVVLGAAFLASALVYAHAFGPYLTFEGEGRLGRFLKLFLLPLAATAIMLIVGSLRRTPDEHAAGDRAIDNIVFIVVLFLTSVHGLLLGALLSAPWIGPSTSRLVVILVGLATIGIANQLPRTRPNHAIGIRTVRTLADRQLWIRTHRISGYVGVAVGVAIVCGGLLMGRAAAASAGIAGLAGAVITLGWYWKYSLAIRRT